jgi:hypothetical protein
LTDATLLRRINASYEDIVVKILKADGTWQFDDLNYTTNPVGVGDLTTGVNTYTFSDKFLDLEEIDILDANGYFIRLKPIDPSELNGLSFEEYFNITYNGTSYTAQSGMPSFYDKQGATIKFNSAPTAAYCTLTKGLRARFKRTADLFTSVQVSAGTKEPGFAINHIVLAYKMALPYAISYKKDRVNAIINEITRLEKEIIDHYSGREKDASKIMTFEQRCFK